MLEYLRIGLNFLGVFALQPLGGQLDRGQGILDLVSDAPGDVGPRGVALRRDKLGDIVERHDESVLGMIRRLGRYAHEQAALLAPRHDADLPLGRARRFDGSLIDERGEGDHRIGDQPVDEIACRHAEKLHGRSIDKVDPAGRVNADHARAHAGQHGLGKAAALVELVVHLHQVIALRFKLIGHLIERAAEGRQVTRPAVGRNLHFEVSFRHPARCVDKRDDGLDQPVGEPESEPDGRQQEDQRNSGIDQSKCQLNALALVEHLVEFSLALARRFELPQHLGIDEPGNV